MPTWKIIDRKKIDLIDDLLFQKGIDTPEQKEAFFNPKIQNYPEEISLSGIDQAKKRIEQAIKKNQTIFVYGDYDVDGVASSAVIYHALKSLGANILPYIPHRDKEGYGLSKIGIDEIKSKGCQLLITVDHGIVAFEQVKYAKSLGLDVILTDHHTRLDHLPEADIIIHSINICGAGVAWCLARKLVDEVTAQKLLQFVCLGTVTDVMPLVGINRALVWEGLKELNKTDNPGLKALMLETGLNLGEISAFEIGFVLGPRINAIGRLEHAIDALRLLCTNDLLKATKLARLLCDTNIRRQKLTTIAYEQARAMIIAEKKIYVVDSPDWVSGIIGLVAAKVSDEYSRPVIAISRGDKFSKGSARSINGINIVESIRSCSDILVDVGGHSGAAGFTIETEKIEEFKKRLDDYFNEVEIVTAAESIEIAAELSNKDISRKLFNDLCMFEPFGAANPKPIFATRRMQLEDVRAVGEGKHLKLRVDGIDGIGFGLGEWADKIMPGQKIDLAYFLDLNRFNGKEILQLRIKDLIISD